MATRRFVTRSDIRDRGAVLLSNPTLDARPEPLRIEISRAGVTQLVECLLPKQNVAGSSPVSRSTSPSELETTPCLVAATPSHVAAVDSP